MTIMHFAGGGIAQDKRGQRQTMSRTRKEKERAQKIWAERRELLRFGYGKLAESIVRDARGHYQQALQAWQKGDLVEAEAELRKALELNPDAPDPLLALGQLLLEGNRAEEAIGHLSKAGDLDADNPEALYWFGRALEATGRMRRAKDAYERALQQQPHPELMRELQERLQVIDKVLTQQPLPALSEDQAKALEEALHWAKFYLDMGFPRRAREYVLQGQAIAPQHPQVQALASAIEKALGSD